MKPAHEGTAMADPLLEAVRTFTRAINNPFDTENLLAHLIDCVTDIVAAEGAGLMLVGRDGELGFAAASHPSVEGIEIVQAETRSGACYEAFKNNEIVAIADLDALVHRWPKYGARAQEAGFEAVLGIPLNAWGQTIGVLNVYRRSGRRWTDDDIHAVEIVGALGASYLLSSTQRKAQTDLTDQLQHALDSRVVIEQAKGILMSLHQLDARSAFEAIRRHARNNNRRLRDVAEEIVASSAKQRDPST